MNCRFDLIRMKGVVISSNPNEAALKELLDAFGSKFSLEEIATAYYEAKGNVSITADILYARNNGRTSKEAVDTYENKSAAANTTSMKLLSGWESETTASPKYTSSNLNSEALKSKRGSVSMGSVSSLIGKNYVKPRPSRMDSLNTTKPVKIDSKEFPASLIWNEEAPSCRTTRNNTKNGDLEKFLFEMLGDGFQLDKSVIQEVLDCCGFDVDKSMDKLLDMSASTLEKSDDVIGIAAEKITGSCLDQTFLIREKLQSKDFSQGEEATHMIRNSKRSPRGNQDKAALEKEILQTLFTVPERSGEATKRNNAVREVRRSKALGELVTEPLKDTDISFPTVVEMLKVPKDVEDRPHDNENTYDSLRQAVKEYWLTMKEYYKSAAEAYTNGDKARATELMEIGHFFNKRAREADEKSSAKMLESSCSDEEIMSLDLRDFEPKEALSLLRTHLSSISGIPTFKYLRIIVGTIEEDTEKGARKRLIMRQLEKESIKWTEEENGRIILIQVDIINPKNLSFAKKNQTNLGSS
ncbi:putative nuclear RNA export factor SDE5 [Gossypium arboreum]|uniref:putative nuclear RNA export factor SDE5 n=1 Tax=Gossypium arboreum TaxID=29729 RepID=UPI0008190A7E|nr:putative nuclear RNA export factor SDE5 [Gossypium arboreum]XP_052886579.1 putative nuclear RNA export factor SDE5 [Gossypium arboreum]